MVTITGKRVERTCSGGKLHATFDYTDDDPGMNPLYIIGYWDGREIGNPGIISPGQVKSFSFPGDPGQTVALRAEYSHYWAGPSVSATMHRIFPRLSLDRLNFLPEPCSGVKESIKATVSEVGGRCRGNFHLNWLGERTKSMSILAGGATEVPFEFKVPKNPLDITVELFGEERNTTVSRRIASIRPKIPDVDISDFHIPGLPAVGKLCTGKRIDGSILIKMLECAQELRGKVIDTVSGKTFASFGPEEYEPRDEIEPSFSFSMPRSPVSLKAVVERRTPEGWETIKSQTKDIMFKKPELEIGGIRI